jgi:cell division protein FtsB
MTAASVARALPRALQQSPRPAYLRLVAARRSSAAKTPFVLVVVLILVTGLLGLLALNTVLAQDAFKLHALQVSSRVLADREQALQRQVADLQSPQSLAARATRQGMVPGGPPAFLQLPDGKVLGAPEPGADPLPIVLPAPVTAKVVIRRPAVAKPQLPGGWQAAPRRGGPTGSTTWTAPRRTRPGPAGGSGR